MKYYRFALSIGDLYNTYIYVVAAPNAETAKFLVEEKIKSGHNVSDYTFISSREIPYTHSVVGVILEVYTGK